MGEGEEGVLVHLHPMVMHSNQVLANSSCSAGCALHNITRLLCTTAHNGRACWLLNCSILPMPAWRLVRAGGAGAVPRHCCVQR